MNNLTKDPALGKEITATSINDIRLAQDNKNKYLHTCTKCYNQFVFPSLTMNVLGETPDNINALGENHLTPWTSLGLFQKK